MKFRVLLAILLFPVLASAGALVEELSDSSQDVDGRAAQLGMAVMFGRVDDDTVSPIKSTSGSIHTIPSDGTNSAGIVQHLSRATDLDDTYGLNVAAVTYHRVDDNTVKIARMDGSTEAIMAITYAHHEIHEGDDYHVFRNKDVVGAGTFNIFFTTPNTTKWMHFTFSVSHELEAEFKFYEGVTGCTSGTAITPDNSNRNSITFSAVSDMVFDCTLTLGTPITLVHEVGGSGKKFGAASDHDTEWILKQNTNYLMQITNQSTGAAANESNFELDWYEHTARN